MNKKLVIFDLDGTLLNTIDDLAVSANYALRQHGYPEHELPAYRYFVGNGITKLIERALPEAERCEPAILQLREEFVGYYQRHKTDPTRLIRVSRNYCHTYRPKVYSLLLLPINIIRGPSS